MNWSAKLGVGAVTMMLAAGTAWAADLVPGQIDAARAAYQKNDLARTAKALEAALSDVHDRLGKALVETMPGAPAGWQADPAEVQGLGQVGGGLAVTRAYAKGEASLNATLFLDSPAVDSAAAQFANTAPQSNLKRIKVGAEDALLRFDSANQAGEITIILGNRALLAIEGDNLSNGDILAEAAKGWNVAKIKAVAGL